MNPFSRKKRLSIAGISLSLGFLILANCASRTQHPELTPGDEDFLSKVRYIITKQERKAFLELPPSERGKFIEEFWKKRDPDPYTEENEYREQYMERVEEADRRFSGEGRPGWLTDRGRIYILFGPPTQIQRHKGGYMDMSRNIYRDTIIWYYFNYPIVFVDKRGTGEFELTYLSLQHLDTISQAISRQQEAGMKGALPENILFDFKFSTKKNASGFTYIILEFPYKNLWFSEVEGRVETTLSILLKIKDAGGKTLVADKKDYPLSFTEEELLKVKDKNYLVKIPLLLGEGKYEALLTATNSASSEKMSKKLSFTISKNLSGKRGEK